MGVQISEYYMIGDNTHGDIGGAKNMGWQSMLVKTGLYKEGHSTNGATHVMTGLDDCIEHIFNKHGL